MLTYIYYLCCLTNCIHVDMLLKHMVKKMALLYYYIFLKGGYKFCEKKNINYLHWWYYHHERL